MGKCILELGHFTGCHGTVAHSLPSQQLPAWARDVHSWATLKGSLDMACALLGHSKGVVGEESEKEQSQRTDQIFQR